MGRYYLGNAIFIVGVVAAGGIGLFIIFSGVSIVMICLTVIVFFVIMGLLFVVSNMISFGRDDKIQKKEKSQKDNSTYQQRYIPEVENFANENVHTINESMPVEEAENFADENIHTINESTTVEDNKNRTVQVENMYEQLHFYNQQDVDVKKKNRYENLNEESDLRKLGYTVSKSIGYTDTQRQNLLKAIIDSGEMKGEEVIKHLEWDIKRAERRPSWKIALDKYKKDLRYIREYVYKYHNYH